MVSISGPGRVINTWFWAKVLSTWTHGSRRGLAPVPSFSTNYGSHVDEQIFECAFAAILWAEIRFSMRGWALGRWAAGAVCTLPMLLRNRNHSRVFFSIFPPWFARIFFFISLFLLYFSLFLFLFRLFIYPSIYLSIYLSVYVSINPSIHLTS